MSLGDLRERRFVIPGEELNAGFNRRLRRLCREHGFVPRTVTAAFIWDEGEWPPGEDVVTLATARVARNVPMLRGGAWSPSSALPLELVWREDDDSPLLRTFLEVATPAPEPEPPGAS